MQKSCNILVITYWSLNDPLIQTYTLPYLRIIRSILPPGSNIHLITLEKEGELPVQSKVEDRIFRTSFRLHLFGATAFLEWRKNVKFLVKMSRECAISYIHCWCTPAGAIGWWLSRKTRLPLIIDSYEPHADSMVENGTWTRNGIAFRLLHYLEKKQTHHARWLIGTVAKMKSYAEQRYGYSGNNFLNKPACIDTGDYSAITIKNPELIRETGIGNNIVCVYAGKFGGIYLREEAFRFFKVAAEYWGGNFRILLLTNTQRSEIETMAAQAGLNPDIIINRFVPHSTIPEWLALGDFAFSAIKPVPSKRFCTPIKDGEFWASGLPVVIPDGISDDSEIIEESGNGYVLKKLNDEEYRSAVQHIDSLLRNRDREQLKSEVRALAEKHRTFAFAEHAYRKIYGNE